MDGENWGGNCARPHSELLGLPRIRVRKEHQTGFEVPVLFNLSRGGGEGMKSRLQTLQYLERTCKDLLCRMSLMEFRRPEAEHSRLPRRPSQRQRRLSCQLLSGPLWGAVMLTVGGVVSGGGGGGLLAARKATICITHPPPLGTGAVAL